MTDMSTAKDVMRRAAMSVRDKNDPTLGGRLADHVLGKTPPPKGAVVAGFWPLGAEIDIRPLLLALHARGHAIVLPETPPRGNPLMFRLWSPGETMVRERFGTMRPNGEVCRPDWLFVPLLAFDRAGGRLGYGGGYYDRTLEQWPAAVAVGCGFAAQEVPIVPAEPHDVRLHAVATEREIFWCRTAV